MFQFLLVCFFIERDKWRWSNKEKKNPLFSLSHFHNTINWFFILYSYSFSFRFDNFPMCVEVLRQGINVTSIYSIFLLPTCYNAYMLCISNSFWVRAAPKSWSNYFFLPFSSFFVNFKHISGIITTWIYQ